MAEHRLPGHRAPGGVAGDHLPDDAVVAALALDAALDLAPAPAAAGAGGDLSVADDLLAVAAAVRAAGTAVGYQRGYPVGDPSVQVTNGRSHSPARHAPAVVGHAFAPVVPLRTVSLPPAVAPPRQAGPVLRQPRRVPRRSRSRRVAAVTAAVASAALLAIGADVGLRAGGGTRSGLASARLAVAGGRVMLAPAGGGLSAAARLAALTCPTERHCLAIADTGGHAVIAVSNDGGTTWQRAASDAATELSAVLCATPQRCWAVGSDGGTAAAVVATADGGRTWTTEAVPTGVASLQSISCATVRACWAVGSAAVDSAAAIVATTDGGRTWTTEAVPAGVASLQSVSCPSVEACWAGGRESGGAGSGGAGSGGAGSGGAGSGGAALVTTADGGSRWQQQALPAVGAPEAATGGTTSSRRLATPGATVSSVTCTSSATCWAAVMDGGRLTVLDGGAGAWRVSAHLPDGGVLRVGYVAAPGCRAGCPSSGSHPTDTALATVEGRTAPELGGPTAAGALTCPTETECWMVRAVGAGFASDALTSGPADPA